MLVVLLVMLGKGRLARAGAIVSSACVIGAVHHSQSPEIGAENDHGRWTNLFYKVS